MKRLLMMVFVLAMFAVPMLTMAEVSDGTLVDPGESVIKPTSFFYPIQLLSESVVSVFKIDPESKIDRALVLSERRTDELETYGEDLSDNRISQMLDNYDKQYSSISKNISKVENKEQVAQRVVNQYMHQYQYKIESKFKISNQGEDKLLKTHSEVQGMMGEIAGQGSSDVEASYKQNMGGSNGQSGSSGSGGPSSSGFETVYGV